MSWKTLTASVRAVTASTVALGAAAAETRSEVEALTASNREARKTSQDLVKEGIAQREANTLEQLKQGVTGPMWQSWWQLAVVDANSPGLISLEREMRRITQLDISFLMGMRRELARVQQMNRSKSRRGRGGALSGALSENQASMVMEQYSGGGDY